MTDPGAPTPATPAAGTGTPAAAAPGATGTPATTSPGATGTRPATPPASAGTGPRTDASSGRRTGTSAGTRNAADANAHLPVVTPHAETGGVHPATAAVRLMPTRPGPTAHPALPQPELDVIRIHGLHVRGYHGVHDHERTEGQDFFIDADVWIDTREAATSDDIVDTLHYGHLMRALADVGSGPPVDLLETLAERLAAVTLAFQGPQAVRITVHKPKAPVKLRFDDVTVSILRFRPEGESPDGEIPDAPGDPATPSTTAGGPADPATPGAIAGGPATPDATAGGPATPDATAGGPAYPTTQDGLR